MPSKAWFAAGFAPAIAAKVALNQAKARVGLGHHGLKRRAGIELVLRRQDGGITTGYRKVGGTLMEVQQKAGPADLAKMRSTLSGLGLGEVQLQQFGTPSDVLIRVAQQPGGDAAQQAAVDKVKGALGSDVEYRRVEVVGPRVSTELLAYGTLGLVVAILGILVYLWFRFEWQFALGAMIANVHDIVLTIGFMSITQIDFDLTSIAALLTILGYSLNDTVVIYDRIRENLRKYKRMPMPDLLNSSINSTLSRSGTSTRKRSGSIRTSVTIGSLTATSPRPFGFGSLARRTLAASARRPTASRQT